MIDEETLAQINGKYVCPSDAGPAWRAAVEQGEDMSLVEEALKLSPWDRLIANDRALAIVREVENAKSIEDGTSD
jgi:hypothetical protein